MKTYLTFGGTQSSLYIYAYYADEKRSIGLFTNKLETASAPIRIYFKKDTLSLERFIDGTWQHEPFKQANITQDGRLKETTELPPNPYTLPRALEDINFFRLMSTNVYI